MGGTDEGGSQRDRGMLSSSFNFITIRGIPIGAHWSWLLVFALLAWTLVRYLFPVAYPGLEEVSYVVMGLAATLLFFVSILLHELGHAFRAIKEGLRIDGITLWLFGGVAKFRSMFPSAGAEFRIAAAGPAVSILLGGLFFAGSRSSTALGWPLEVVGVLDYLARINLLVVAFNLIPALPLDGGRILRSWLWHRRGNFTSATISAARGGKAFAYFMVGFGVLGVFTGAVSGGIWWVFLGWFLLQAAQSEATFAMLRQVFNDLRVRDLMTPNPVTVPSRVPIVSFLEEYVGARGHSTYPVVDGGHLVGLVSLRMAGEVPGDDRNSVTVDDIMLTGDDIPRVSKDDPMLDVLEVMRQGPGRAVVVDDGRPEGIVSMSDLARAAELERLRGEGEPERRGGILLVWGALLLLLLVAGAFYHPPLAVIEPGPAIDISDDIRLIGVEADDLNGRYLLTSVQISRSNALDTLVAVVDPRRQVQPLGAVTPPGVDPEEHLRRQRGLFQESRDMAAVAAAQALGMEVEIHGRGAQVLSVLPGTPADGNLDGGDVIVGIDDAPIALASDLVRAVSSRPAGTTIRLRVERGAQEIEVELTTAILTLVDRTGPGIGVEIATRDFSAGLPFEVEFVEQDIGGPSAGLAYALLIVDLLDPSDLADGRTIAATGTIDFSGRVGDVGAVDLKGVGAKAEGSHIFFVPDRQVDQAVIEGLDPVGVATLMEALEVLERR